MVPASSSSSRLSQPPNVVAPAPVTELERVAPGERPQVGGRSSPSGIRAPDTRTGITVTSDAAQGRANLEPDEVLGVGDPHHAVVVGDRRPARAR